MTIEIKKNAAETIIEVAGRLATETMDMQPSGVEFDVNAHIAPGFGQMYGCDGKDGYVYIFGRRSDRTWCSQKSRRLRLLLLRSCPDAGIAAPWPDAFPGCNRLPTYRYAF